jgi:hypothetical protein
MKKTSLMFMSLLLLTFSSCMLEKEFVDKTIIISSNTTTCNKGHNDTDCLLVKWNETQKNWSVFYDSIVGFNYEKGKEYVLEVKVQKVLSPPADASNIRYELIRVIKETEVK